MEQLSLKRSHDDDDDNTTSSKKRERISINCYLTYDILRIVFKYLNLIDLQKAAAVCRSWLEVANDEKRSRGGFTYLQLKQSSKLGLKNFRSKIVKQLQVKPVLGLFFRAPYTRDISEDCYYESLPSNCDAITLTTYSTLIDSQEMLCVLPEILVCAFLPDIPNVRIEIVTVPFRKHTGYYSQMKTAFSTFKNSNFKCLLLFSNQTGRNAASKIADELKASNKARKPSIWGGVVGDLRICNSKNFSHTRCAQSALGIGVAIFGSVDTWSIVIDRNHNTKELVEQRLALLKNHVSLRKHSMAFMFACCERGQNMFKEYHVESSIFKKLFPQVPLVGCFGDGEFGDTTIPQESSVKQKRSVYNEKSTIVLIITYG